MDEKSYRRYESFKRSLDALNEAKERDLEDSFVLSGTGAKFSITFDISWKVMKDIIIERYGVIDFVKGSPREVLRKAFELEIISDEIWMEMLQNRNDLTHDYDGNIITAICRRIVNCYIDIFYDFADTACRLLEKSQQAVLTIATYFNF